MKRMTKMAAVIMAMVALMAALTGIVAGAEMTHGNIIGKWVSSETIGNTVYTCEYSFYADGTYDYLDDAIQYEECGEYEIQDNCLILIREDGGMEVYRLDLAGYTFYDMEEEDAPLFAREVPVAMTAANAGIR